MEAGVQKVNGVEAVTYARIRKNVGGDYARTERQRLVIEKLVKKAKEADLSDIMDMVDTVFPKVSTSFELADLLGYATGISKYKLGETSGFAFEHKDGRIEGIGSVIIPVDVTKNVKMLHEFLYPKDEYTPSATVQETALEIEERSGQKVGEDN
jgi:anionic cell wall polymer biosynthesis LytR-Cps2A-Psr (LCP) family protein